MSSSEDDGDLRRQPLRRASTHPDNLFNWDKHDRSFIAAPFSPSPSSPPPPERARTWEPKVRRESDAARRLREGLERVRRGDTPSPERQPRRPLTPEQQRRKSFNQRRPSGGELSVRPDYQTHQSELRAEEKRELEEAENRRLELERWGSNPRAVPSPPSRRPSLSRSTSYANLQDLLPPSPPPNRPLPPPPAGVLPPLRSLPPIIPLPPVPSAGGLGGSRHGSRPSSSNGRLPPNFEQSRRGNPPSSGPSEGGFFSLGAGNIRRAQIYGRYAQQRSY